VKLTTQNSFFYFLCFVFLFSFVFWEGIFKRNLSIVKDFLSLCGAYGIAEKFILCKAKYYLLATCDIYALQPFINPCYLSISLSTLCSVKVQSTVPTLPYLRSKNDQQGALWHLLLASKLCIAITTSRLLN